MKVASAKMNFLFWEKLILILCIFIFFVNFDACANVVLWN